MPSNYNSQQKEISQRRPIWRRMANASTNGFAVMLSDSKGYEVITAVECGVAPERILAVDFNQQKLSNMTRSLPEELRGRIHTKSGDIAEVARLYAAKDSYATAFHVDFKSNCSRQTLRTLEKISLSGFMRQGSFAVSVLNGREMDSSLIYSGEILPGIPLARFTLAEQGRAAAIYRALKVGFNNVVVSWYGKYVNEKTSQSMLWILFDINLLGEMEYGNPNTYQIAFPAACTTSTAATLFDGSRVAYP